MNFRARQNRRSRSQMDPSLRPIGTPANAALSFAGTVLSLDFDNPVQLNSPTVPISVGTLTVQGAAQITPTRIDVTFSGTIAVGMSYTIPARMQEVRTPTGGYVAALAGTF